MRNAESTSSLIAGAGLTGGGALNSASSVTFNVGAGNGIIVNADSIELDTSVVVSGSGTLNTLAKWTPSEVLLGDSLASDDGSTFTIQGLPSGSNTGAQIAVYSGSAVDGGSITMTSGDGVDPLSDAGSFALSAGGGVVEGGAFVLSGGPGIGSAQGGSASLRGGNGGSLGGSAGAGVVQGGSAMGGSANGGDVALLPGPRSGGGSYGILRVTDPASGFKGRLSFAVLAADRTFTFPDATGTIALTSDLTAYQPLDADLTSWAAITRASGFDTFTATPTLANLSALVSDANIARTDAAQTFAGVQTFSAQDVHTLGIDLSTSGVITSQVADSGTNIGLTYKPTTAYTGTTFIHSFQKSTGGVLLCCKADETWEFGGSGTAGGYITVGSGVALTSTTNFGIFFSPTFGATAGGTVGGIANVVCSAVFQTVDVATSTATTVIGGAFVNSTIAARAHTNIIGGLFNPAQTITSSGSPAHGSIYGWMVRGVGTSMGATATAIYGGRVNAMLTGITPATTDAYGLFVEEQVQATNKYGLWLGGTTAGYKALSLGSTSNWIGPESSTTFSLNATTVIFKADADHTAKNIVTDGTTGTKIGTATTQKFSFWNAATIVQPTTAVAAATFVANTSLIFDDSATFDGYTLGQVVKALRNMGILA